MKISTKFRIALALTFLISGSPVSAEESVGPLARIGDQDIPATELQAILATLDSAQIEVIRNDPQALGMVVRNYLIQKLVLAKANEENWESRPEVQAAIEAARDNAIVEAYLSAQSKADDGYPSDEEVATVYEENKSALRQPRQFDLAQIFVALPEDAGAEAEAAARAKLETIQSRLSGQDVDFGVIARLHSDEPVSADRGGELGFLPETQIRPEIRAAVSILEPGQISDPVQLDDGFYIVKCNEIRQARTPELEEVKDILARQMRLETEQVNRQNYILLLLGEKAVSINEIAVTNLLKQIAE
ncbi:MAG: peptidylprolyl isomerase [Verrucomicrobiales bacterium]